MVKAAHNVVTKTIQTDDLCNVSQKKSNPEIGTFIMPIHDGDCGWCPHIILYGLTYFQKPGTESFFSGYLNRCYTNTTILTTTIQQ